VEPEPLGAPQADDESMIGWCGAPAGADSPDVRAEPVVPPPAISPVVDVMDLDWVAIHRAVERALDLRDMRAVIEQAEELLDRDGGSLMLFDADRADRDDRVIRVAELPADSPLWFIGDLHGDLLALEAALALIHRESIDGGVPRIVFLGDFFDDAGYGLELLIRVFRLIGTAPETVCTVIGNHDEALQYTGTGFSATVSPSDFADFLNANLGDEWITRAGKLAVRMAARGPRALILPDGLLVTHGGFPLVDLHEELRSSGNWNDPRCLSDFTWTRAHPRARRKMPNRTTRGSQFGHEDFAAFCALSADLGSPVTHMVRGHDHVDERFEIYPAYKENPVLTTVALSRQLPRELLGPYERVPTIARHVAGALPEVYRLHVPAALVRDLYPEPVGDEMPLDSNLADGATT
jgi:hypothetical protein